MKIWNMKFLALVALVCLMSCQFTNPTKPIVERPNIIVIFADDQGYQDIACFGSPLIKTPYLDQMATEGLKLTSFYSVSSVCTPSRAGLLTGCYAYRVGLPKVLFPDSRIGLNPKETTIADFLKTQEYATACIGKWHLGDHEKFLPTQHGFDYYFGVPYSNDMGINKKQPFAKDAVIREGVTKGKKTKNNKNKNKNKKNNKSENNKTETYPYEKNLVPLYRNTEIIEYPTDQSLLSKRYTEEALKFIDKNKTKPFFIYMPHTMPHIPLFASEQFKGKSKRGLYGDVIEEMDWSVGQILNKLKELELDKKTLVIYTSDNGPWLSFGKNGGSASPLRDGKFSVFEGGHRVPTIAWWPGKVPAGKSTATVASSIDILPTIAKLAGGELKTAGPIDGKDISKVLFSPDTASSPHEYFYYYTPNAETISAIRYKKWKLVKAGAIRYKKKSWPTSLYDLENDISEKVNLAEKHPELVKKLEAQIAKFEKDVADNVRKPGRS